MACDGDEEEAVGDFVVVTRPNQLNLRTNLGAWRHVRRQGKLGSGCGHPAGGSTSTIRARRDAGHRLSPPSAATKRA